MCEECGCGLTGGEKREVKVFEEILKHNQIQAEHNKKHLEEHGIFSINLMSAPGSGKTTLLEKTIELLQDEFKIGIIEGDLETERDAERIRKKGVPVYQITTGSACHLDASLVHKAFHHLPLEKIDLLFVENIGNLVCPANYDLGTHLNVTLLSVPEGEDKPEKYPLMFKVSDLVLITKIDLLPYFDFDPEKVKAMLKKIKPDVEVKLLSARTGEGMEEWISFLKENVTKFKARA